MKVLREAHRYELDNFEEGGEPQVLQFIEKEPDGKGGSVTVFNGTTNEELLEVLLDRLNTLNSKFPCRENAAAITSIEVGLMWLNRRTENRVKRGVEGKHVK